VGLKENQKLLKKQVSLISERQPFLAKLGTEEKGHGRIEVRKYEFYDVLEMKKDERWNNCQIRTAIKVKRERIELKSGKKSVEDALLYEQYRWRIRRTSRSDQKTLASGNK